MLFINDIITMKLCVVCNNFNCRLIKLNIVIFKNRCNKNGVAQYSDWLWSVWSRFDSQQGQEPSFSPLRRV
jgi:hypothetical protein